MAWARGKHVVVGAATPTSICIAEILDSSINKNNKTLFVNIGLANGILLRTVLDSVNAQLTETRTHIIVLSSRTWLNYTFQNLLNFGPLIYDALDNVHSFSAELCPEGLISIDPMPLAYTPRKILLDPATKHDITVESEHRTMAPDVQVARFSLQKAHKTVYNIFDDPILAAFSRTQWSLPSCAPGEESRRQSSLLRPACASLLAPGARSSISSALAFVVKAGLLGLRLGASAAARVLLALPGVLASVLDVLASAFVAVAALWIVNR
ncbi:hypothetical protein PtA15_3A474 [Puccinia triticina]|uniref:RSE1/DDB1/CPSF1 second beta-propeller domain-containing protein n=1 Tax=Puccinia triticina TaxID=208348 RepID=A0ABY7CF49_9BASI|nr:uncharacterized protein PtA15_3A474 [Puccinia triticina]WAQ83107.1 hypothetical protein PtA15_3A474 [Puccinia triticina]WAR53950.1 hypothetical protein PtB15_3B459 [Puccinia triticina]